LRTAGASQGRTGGCRSNPRHRIPHAHGASARRGRFLADLPDRNRTVPTVGGRAFLRRPFLTRPSRGPRPAGLYESGPWVNVHSSAGLAPEPPRRNHVLAVVLPRGP